tara:strand:- start:12244 stop:12414 length:171 start_codon:yes stop_codon:yes gene_type:complete
MKQRSDFKTEGDAYRDALREKHLEDKLNNLYALSDRFPDDIEIEQEIEELEKELGY